MIEDQIAALWSRFQGQMERRLETLEAWHRGEVDHAAALVEAHQLAGSLGSFGRPAGSEAAAELESMIASHLDEPGADPRSHPSIAGLLDQIRGSVV